MNRLILFCKQRLVNAIETNPRWLSWLAVSSSALNSELRNARRTFFIYQLPLLILTALIVGTLNQFNHSEQTKFLAGCIAIAGLATMCWPVSWLRIARTALRESSNSIAFTVRLRALGYVAYLIAILSSICMLIFISLCLFMLIVNR